jgi:hypothetical protein
MFTRRSSARATLGTDLTEGTSGRSAGFAPGAQTLHLLMIAR